MDSSTILEYRGYVAELSLDTEDEIIIGRVINAADIISFHGETVEKAKKAFYEVLDTYLETCRKEGISLPDLIQADLM